MFKKLLLGIIAVSALALLWTEANAQECLRWRNVGGSQTCVRWSPGSEVCDVKISGLQGGLGGEAANVDVTCEITGAATGGRMTGSLFCTIPGQDSELTAATQVEGCKHVFNGVGTGHTTNADNPAHSGDCNVFRNVTTADPVFDTETVGLTQCNGKVCQTSATLDISPSEGQALCNAAGGGTFVTFTADTFLGDVFIDGLPGAVSCNIEQLCTLNGNSYNCVPTSEPFCSSID
jgi:hypothetical protein